MSWQKERRVIVEKEIENSHLLLQSQVNACKQCVCRDKQRYAEYLLSSL